MTKNLFPQNQMVAPEFDLKSIYQTVLKSLFTVVLLFLSVFGWGQTTATYTFSVLGGSNITNPSGNIDSNISYTSAQNSGTTGATYQAGGLDLRLYYQSNGNAAGSSINLTANNGVTITGIEFETVSTTYNPTMRYSIGAAAFTASDPTIARSNTTYSVTGLAVTSSIKIRNANTTNTQMRMMSIKVTYTGGATTISSNAVVGNWSSTSSWVGGIVPTSADNVIIVSGAVISMDSDTYATRNSGTTTVVNAGGTLATNKTYFNKGTTTINGLFQLNAGGWVSDEVATPANNPLVYGTNGTLIFAAPYGANNGNYWPTTNGPVNVTVNASSNLDLGFARTVTGLFQTSSNINNPGNITIGPNGTFQLNGGYSFSGTGSPTYGASSLLKYNSGGTPPRAAEWTTATSGAGYPANVQVSNASTVDMGSSSAQCSKDLLIDTSARLNTTTTGLTVLGNVTSNGTISLGGDVTTQGNWTIGASGSQLNNGKAVFFTKASGDQIITKTGAGIVYFDYLVLNKAAGNVQLSASPATSVTLNTAAGDVLQLSNAGALDLNGQTLTLNNNGGSIAANAAGRSITSGPTGATLAITGTKSFNGAGTLVINTNVTTVLSAGFDFGVNKVTVNGVLQLNGGGFATNGSAPTYASGSTLLFNTGGNYDMHNGTADVAGWFRNVASTGSAQAGVPWNVTISNNTSVRYNSANNDVFPRSINGNLLINTGSSLTLGGLSGTAGDFFLRGNWTNNGTFNPNTRLVSFNGTTAQTITGATTFDFLTVDNSTGLTLQASSQVTVNQTLALTSGKITIGANNLTVGGLMTGYNATNYVVTASTGQLKRTVGGSAIDFPVGNTVYNPITFTNSGTSDTYGVRVSNAVPAGANNTKTVTRQWITTEAVAGGSILAVTAQYNTGETGAGFAAATDYYIGHYNGTAYSQQVDATQSGSNPFTVASNSNLSPADLSTGTQYFAIGKDNGLVSVPYGYRVDTITPTSPTAGTAFSAKVTALDKYGAVTTISSNSAFNLTTNGNAGAITGTTSGTILSGTNSVTVTGIILPTAGTGVTLTATNATGLSLTAGTSATFIVLDKADHLAFAGVPATGNVGVNLASFTVRALRPDNTLDDTYTGAITIAKLTGSGVLSGTLTVSAVAGVATFSTAQFDTADTYTLTTTSGSLTSATSGNIVVSLAPTVIAQFDFTPFTLPTAAQVTLKDANVSVTDFAISAGTLSAGVTTGTNFPNEPYVAGTGGYTSTTQSGAKNFNFNVTANIGYEVEVTSLQFNALATTAGPSAISFDIASGTASYTANAGDTVLLSVDQPTFGLSNLTTIPVLIQGWLNGSRTSSGAGNFRIDDVILKGYVTCKKPTAYTVTGGGAVCSGTGVPVGLSNSQLGMTYQLQIDGVNSGSAVPGTGGAISFGNQTAIGTYTVIAKNTNGSCNLSTTMTGSVTIVTNISTTWKITSPATTPAWDNGAPNSVTYQMTATIEADYAEAADIIACSLSVTNNANVTIPTGNSVTLNGALNVATGSSFTLETDANLVQKTQATNTGSITVKRAITIKDNKQYNYLISPTGSGLKTDLYGPGNSAQFTLYHNEANNIFSNSSGAYIKGRGLAVKEPITGSGTVTAIFKGVPMNEAFTYNLANSNVGTGTTLGYNLTGNPYPSNIDLDKLYNLGSNKANISPTFYFWDNTVNAATSQGGTGYSGAAYALFNAAAGSAGTGTAAGSLSGSVNGNKIPTRVVKTGQAFMVQSIEKVNKTLYFDNNIRTADAGVGFFGNASKGTVTASADDRFWLNLAAPSSISTQIAVVYFDGGVDAFAIDDSKLNGLPSDVLYSVIGDQKAVINGRASFVNTDSIPLGSNSFTAGTFTFSLGNKEGKFANGQNIYLKDKQTGIVTNLSEGNYTFTANAGESTGRFEIIYQPETVLATDTKVKESLIIYKDGNDFVVKAQNKKISSLEVFDSAGRLIWALKPESIKAIIPAEKINNGLYVLKINQNGEITSKKIIR